ncbi:MAG: hypothetical protein KAS07_03350 [Candidatus Pacebacteria bacterium]|nr:hypothetical protein [Candidatus Paceibacterota bacterium]
MNLRKACKNKTKKITGFSVIEMLIVIGVVMLIVGITAPVGFRYYQTQLLDESACLVFDTLRRAQQNALFQKKDSRFGVFFEENSFTLFEGNTFLTRDENEDEIFILSNNISLGGLQEVVFSRKYGTTTTGGEIVISMGERVKYVDINTKGRVDKR